MNEYTDRFRTAKAEFINRHARSDATPLICDEPYQKLLDAAIEWLDQRTTRDHWKFENIDGNVSVWWFRDPDTAMEFRLRWF